MPSVIEKIEALSERLDRARVIVSQRLVHPIFGQPYQYAVESATSGVVYLVGADCTCPDAQHRNPLNLGLCKHKLAVALYEDQLSADSARPSAGVGKISSIAG